MVHRNVRLGVGEWITHRAQQVDGIHEVPGLGAQHRELKQKREDVTMILAILIREEYNEME